MTLIERLLELARLWCAAHDRSLSRLATIVANDGKTLGRLEEGKTCTVAMFERFLFFFREPANWPGGAIPDAAAAPLEQLAMIATAGAAELVRASGGMIIDNGDSGEAGAASATKVDDFIRQDGTVIRQADAA